MPRKKRPPPPTEAPILKLPNETLEIIFSFLHINSGYRDRRHQPHSLILGLTHVCRRFRRIIHEARFWLKKDFSFGLLTSATVTTPCWPRCSSRWLRTLLSDRYLKNCLERKTEWTFADAKGISIVIDALPSFVNRAKNITFNLDPCHTLVSDFYASSITFHHLIELDLHSLHRWHRWWNPKPVKRRYDLDLIGSCFPALKTLKLTATWGIVKGTLQHFPHLEDFSIEVLSFDPRETFRRLEPPTLLTRLYVNGNAPVSLIDFEYLGHLQHFKVDDIGIFEFRRLLFSMSASNITSFEASVITWMENLPQDDAEEFTEWLANSGLPDPQPLIEAPLPRLHDMKLRFDNASEESEFGRFLPGFEIKALRWVLVWMCYLPAVKTFFLESPLDSAGAITLLCLDTLERLHWVIREDDEIENLVRCDVAEVQEMFDAFRANPAAWLSDMWDEEEIERESKPLIVVERYRDLHPP